MAAPKVGHPLRTLVILVVVIAGLYGLMALNGLWTPKLGLDLRGGTTITLTASNSTGGGSVSAASLEQARTIIQNRVDGLGVGESEVTTSGGRQIVVSVPNVQQDELVALVGQTAVLRFRAVYADQAVQAPPSPSPSPSGSPSASSSSSSSSGPSSAASSGASASSQPSTSGSASGNGRPAPMLPTAPPAPVTPRPTAPGKGTPPATAINWQPSSRDQSDFSAFACGDSFPDVSDQPLITCNRQGSEKFLLGPTLIEGKDLSGASAGIPQNQVAWVVDLSFDSAGSTAFEKATGVLATRTSPENQFAIVLDGRVISAPSVNEAIAGGRAQITGSFNSKTATDLANVLKYGALPLAFEVSNVDNVSATLGGEQLHAGIVAGIIGLALVVGFCFLYYRGLGVVVVASLAVAATLTYACMVLLGGSVGFALNLPGIAGAIVAIGVTADSFVIFFERIRDEVREGRSLRSAVEAGWRRARQTILIADGVSLLSALILFILAIGAVKGFAFTLGLTTLIDVVVVFSFTKPLLTLLARTRFYGAGHRLSGLDAGHLGVPLLPGSRTRARAATALTGRTAHAVSTTGES